MVISWCAAEKSQGVVKIIHLKIDESYKSEALSHEQEEFMELKTDRTFKLKFSEVEVAHFWLHIKNEYSLLSKRAVAVLLPFATTYLCEFGFSTLTSIKSKKRERLRTINGKMRAALSTIAPNFDRLCSVKQAHISH